MIISERVWEMQLDGLQFYSKSIFEIANYY